MQIIKKILILCLLSVVCGRLSAGVQTKKAALPVLLELGSKKCRPCRMMAPVIKDLAENYSGVKVKFVDVWLTENVPLAKKHKISSIPTQIFLDKDGKELWRHVGYISKKDIIAQWEKLGYKLKKSDKKAKKK